MTNHSSTNPAIALADGLAYDEEDKERDGSPPAFPLFFGNARLEIIL
ncbi:hypothetical protein [Methanoregula sp.]